jgi:hypothetical protein
LLTVIRSNDYLPEKYIACHQPDPQPHIVENQHEIEEEPDVFQAIEPDPSIYEPISANGMTAAKACAAVLDQLKVDMPKAAYDKWVRGIVLLSAKDGIFVIGAPDGNARDWLENRLSSTMTRQLTGICNRSVDIRFANINDINA